MSVAEHVMLSILLLVRNFVPAHEVCYYTFYQMSFVVITLMDFIDD